MLRVCGRAMVGEGFARGLLLAALAAVIISTVGCERDSRVDGASNELVIFHAGSLSVPFRDMSARFNERYPNVVIRAEAAGSRDTARKVSDLGRRCDVLASADYRVIDTLLIPEHADYCIRFATNEMAIAYTDQSARAEEITSENWPEVLLKNDVAFGRADPNRDPCGYRTVMVFQLAEKHYEMPNLAQRLEGQHGQKYIRPKETDLLALLEVGEIDFLFIYRSVASQHGLKFIILPDEVNLKSSELAPLYATASVKLTGKMPGEFIERVGAPMVYGMTIPKSCENPKMARAWVEFALSDAGRGIMASNGQPPVTPASTSRFDKLPEVLKPVCARLPKGE